MRGSTRVKGSLYSDLITCRVQSSERVHLRERVYLSKWVHPRKMHEGVHLRENIKVHQRGRVHLIKLERGAGLGQFHILVTTVGHVVL